MQMLDIVKLLIDNLSRHEVIYCHFKSNEHLGAALLGETDLDILFDSGSVELAEEAIFRAGFVRMKAVGSRKYQGIEDYIGIDNKEGKVVHIHAHYQLRGGESGVKPYNIRLENHLLKNARIYSNSCKIYIARPEDELLLLLVRAALKQSLRDRWVSKIRSWNYKGDDLREFLWLARQVSLESFISSLPEEFVNDVNVSIFKKLYKGDFSAKNIAMLYSINKCVFKGWRCLGYKQALLVRTNYFKVRFLKKLKINLQTPQFRTFEGRGLVIAILGCDGAGKSTQNHLIPKELRKKVDVLHMYMGSGDGHASWHRYPMRLLINIKRKFKISNSKGRNDKSRKIENKLSLINFIRILWAVSLALERKKKLIKIDKWRARGGIVVCDRYPQNAVAGYNDGPLLRELMFSKHNMLRKLSKWELGVYDISSDILPDLIIKLWAEVEDLKVRRPCMNIETLHLKQQAIMNLQFHKTVRVVSIHSTEGVNNVFSNIMKEIHISFISNFERGKI